MGIEFYWPLLLMIGFVLGTAFGSWRTEYYYKHEIHGDDDDE